MVVITIFYRRKQMDFSYVYLPGDLTSLLLESLSNRVEKYVEIETSGKVTGLKYQHTMNFIMGEISMLTRILDIEWNYKETGQAYYEFINSLIEKFDFEVQKLTINK